MLSFVKLVGGAPVTTCASEEDTELIDMLRADGFKPYDEDAGKPEVGLFQSLKPLYLEDEEKITLWWEVVEADPEKVQAEIDRLEELISASDYQVIKSYEYTLAGVKIPYDVASLHTRRQALRDQINELKTLLDEESSGIEDLKIQQPIDIGSEYVSSKS